MQRGLLQRDALKSGGVGARVAASKLSPGRLGLGAPGAGGGEGRCGAIVQKGD